MISSSYDKGWTGWTITSPKKLTNTEQFRHIKFGSRIYNGNIVALMWEGKMSFQDLENYYNGTLSLPEILKMLGKRRI